MNRCWENWKIRRPPKLGGLGEKSACTCSKGLIFLPRTFQIWIYRMARWNRNLKIWRVGVECRWSGGPSLKRTFSLKIFSWDLCINLQLWSSYCSWWYESLPWLRSWDSLLDRFQDQTQWTDECDSEVEIFFVSIFQEQDPRTSSLG
jgi:hypothetical protein